MCPSIDPENTTPGMTVTAPGCAGLHPGRGGAHCGAAANQTFEPSSALRAVSPPPCTPSSSALPIGAPPPTPPGGRTTSDTDTYTLRPSLAMPHCTPPFVPPFPTRVCQSSFPWFDGSSAYTTPDFWPATRT